MFQTLHRDIQAVLERDPAARSAVEVILCYPGLHALWGHRLSHWLWERNFKLWGRAVSQLFRSLSGIEIHPGATIGPCFFIDHGMGVVIGETAEIGANVTLYHGVTLGGTSLNKGKRHPTLEDNVVVGAGAKILGAITIGENSRIGANAVVIKPIPPNSVVVGVPGEIVMRSQPRTPKMGLDFEHSNLPDVLGESIIALLTRVDALERHSHIQEHLVQAHIPKDGVWYEEDFVI